MASNRENQGLQIALIIFVILTIVLGVMTYMGQKKFDEQVAALDTAKKGQSAAEEKTKVAEDENAALKTVIGFPATEELAKIQETFKKDFADNGPPGVAPEKQTYRELMASQALAAKGLNTELEKANDLNKKLQADNTQALTAKDAELAKQAAATGDVSKQLTEAQASRDKSMEGFRDTGVKVTKQIDDKNKEIVTLTDSDKKQLETLRNEKDLLRRQYDHLKEMYDAVVKDELVHPEGKISYVNQRDNTVYINLGQDDQLRRGITFIVSSPAENNVGKPVKKASVEVIDVSEAHMAEARITDQTLSNPILPGDVIYSKIWHRGQQQHFALVGFIDLDGDKVSDRQKVRELITMNGGVVDAEMDESGKVLGKITAGTRYLIKGDAPTENSTAPVHEAWKTMLQDAQSMNVETIPVSKFIESVGYVPKSIAPASKATSFRPREPKGAKAPAAGKAPAKGGDKAGDDADPGKADAKADGMTDDSAFAPAKPKAKAKADAP